MSPPYHVSSSLQTQNPTLLHQHIPFPTHSTSMMALSTAKITELGFHHQHRHPIIPFSSRPSFFRFHLFSSSASLRVAERGTGNNDNEQSPQNSTSRGNGSQPRHRRYPWDDDGNGGPRPTTPSPPWLQRWSASPTGPQILTFDKGKAKKYRESDKGGALEKPSSGSIERIVHRLRNLGLEKEEVNEEEGVGEAEVMRLGDLLERSWNRPDSYNVEEVKKGGDLPWERNDGDYEFEFGGEDGKVGLKKRRVRAPTLAELTIEDSELRRLRTLGMTLRERMTIPKAGVTQAIVKKIHDVWRKAELVRLKFHETLALDMKMAHELVERRTGGLVIWRAGSVMVVYRGSAFERSSKSEPFNEEHASTDVIHEGNAMFVPDVSQPSKSTTGSGNSSVSYSQEINESLRLNTQTPEITEEEAEYNHLLDGVGPRFVDWWGVGMLPVDADLLAPSIPGYKPPFRLLPTGMRSRLTNAELTDLRKLARKLPCHFALGRNRNHQGLAAAIVQLWEKTLVVKIAVKRGVQNTNNKLMADELKKLTGGILLQRNKYYIVIYRGKDFLPTSVATALAERQELTKDIQEDEERVRDCVTDISTSNIKDTRDHPAVGTLSEFQEVQAKWGREISTDEREEMRTEASKLTITRFVKRVEHKLSLAQGKKLRAEKLLAKIESSMVPAGPPDDQETITDEERSVFRRIGLRMKAYLPLGIRGVFDGVIENMHLHWKHRELVKLISKQKTLSFVEDTARLLEYESGGILVAIERVPKGYALIYYRGKNYGRPISIRPRNLLTKAKALKRSVAMQRHEALSQHISELERTIEQYKLQLEDSENKGGKREIISEHQFDHDYPSSELESGDEDSSLESEDDCGIDDLESELDL